MLSSSPICGLLLPCCPSAIFRRVASVIVYSIKCKAGRSRAHIRVEILKFLPTLANGYSSTAIILVLIVSLVFTSRAHAKPDDVLGGMTHSMSRESPFRFFAFKAPAAGDFSGSDVVLTSQEHAAANAVKFPFAFLGFPNGGQSSKDLTGDACFFRARSIAAAALIVSESERSTANRDSFSATTFADPVNTVACFSLVKAHNLKHSEFLAGEINARITHARRILQIDSTWHTQTKERCERMANIMKTGTWE
jgi:hypothetical protein